MIWKMGGATLMVSLLGPDELNQRGPHRGLLGAVAGTHKAEPVVLIVVRTEETAPGSKGSPGTRWD